MGEYIDAEGDYLICPYCGAKMYYKVNVNADIDVQEAFDELSDSDKCRFIEENLSTLSIDDIIAYLEQQGYKAIQDD